jgi:hypothetical protein
VSRLVVLNERGHKEGRRLVEVYDDPQPSARIEIAPVEALAAGSRILFAQVCNKLAGSRVGDESSLSTGRYRGA